MNWYMEIHQIFTHYKIDPEKIPAYKFCPVCAQTLTVKMHGGKKRPACPACGFVHFHNPSPVISILIHQDERFILGRRKNEPMKGKWAIPSGYIEFNDNFLATAVQEAKEETGLEVKVTSILNVVSSFYSPDFHFLGLYFSAEVTGGELKSTDDMDDVSWYPLAGPLPDMAYAEDLEAIRLFRLDPSHCLRVECLKLAG
jgi:8-oxo-dGTP diphosphatase